MVLHPLTPGAAVLLGAVQEAVPSMASFSVALLCHPSQAQNEAILLTLQTRLDYDKNQYIR